MTVSERCSDVERRALPFRDGPPSDGACRCGLRSMASVLGWGFDSGGSPGEGRGCRDWLDLRKVFPAFAGTGSTGRPRLQAR